MPRVGVGPGLGGRGAREAAGAPTALGVSEHCPRESCVLCPLIQ